MSMSMSMSMSECRHGCHDKNSDLISSRYLDATLHPDPNATIGLTTNVSGDIGIGIGGIVLVEIEKDSDGRGDVGDRRVHELAHQERRAYGICRLLANTSRVNRETDHDTMHNVE